MAEASVAVLSVGAVFHGRYRVVRGIGVGGMGAVYEVLDERTESRRALKVMLPSLVDDAGLRERFEREAKVTGAIESDHLARVLDAGVDDATGMPFLTMDLLRGEDLGALLKRRTALRPAEVVIYLSQTARALEKAHAQGIIHRDLKPENLFITQRDDGSPCVKILDFGIAKVVVESNQIARTTKLVGTPFYMAPEQILGDSTIGPRADVHALGHIAYTLLVGEAYWSEEAESTPLYGLLMKVMAGPSESASARALRRRGIELPSGFDAWMETATARLADNRFAGAWDASVKLGALVGVAVSRPSLPEVASIDAPSPMEAALAPTEPEIPERPQAQGPASLQREPAVTALAIPARPSDASVPSEKPAPAVTKTALPEPPPSKGSPPRANLAPLPIPYDSEDLISLLRSLTRGAFVARYSYLYLVLNVGDQKAPIPFITAAVSVADKQKLEALMKPVKKPDYEVLVIKKAPGHPYPDRISVGRARNCDLVLRDPSMSKLHAHFRTREDGKFDLVDLDSQNGTFVNGDQLEPNTPQPVWPSDTVGFGNVTAWILDAAALYDVMK